MGPSSSLPATATPFVGRAEQLHELGRLIAAPGLVTLVGAPGVGKTRLALEVVDDADPARPHCFVDLAPLSRPELVAEALVAELGLHERRGVSTTETVVAALATTSALVILDNCEHLVGVCAELAGAILEGCPRITVMATSREPLAAPGEHIWPVEPMPIGDAVRLFYARAEANQVDFAVGDDVAAAVLDICARLEGVPLAIELAAGRVAMLAPSEIASRLADDPLALLSREGRNGHGATERHQTWRAALDWGFTLLSEPEQILLRRLSNFSGGWTLDAAQAVCGAGAGDCADGTADTLAALVAKSLVATRGGDRYDLLGTVRTYAAERLAEVGETAEVTRRHGEWCVAIAEESEAELTGANQLEALARIDAELSNLRAAFERALGGAAFERALGGAGFERALGHSAGDGGDEARAAESGTLARAAESETLARAAESGTLALRIAAALTVWWRVRGRFGEGRRWLDAALARAPASSSSSELRVKALWGAGFLAHMVGDDAAARASLTASLDEARRIGEPQGHARALLLLANVDMNDGALAVLEESASLARAAGDPWCQAHALALAGSVHLHRARLQDAHHVLNQAVAIARANGDLQSLRIALQLLAEVVMLRGDGKTAEVLAEEALAVVRALDDPYGMAVALNLLAELAFGRREYDRAESLIDECLVNAGRAGCLDEPELAVCGLGLVFLAQGKPAEARDCFETARRMRSSPSPQVLRGLGRVAAHERDFDRATALFDQAVAAAIGVDNRALAAAALCDLASVAAEQGQLERAIALWRRALGLFWEVGLLRQVAEVVEVLGVAATETGGTVQAARLLAASQAIQKAHGYRRPTSSCAKVEVSVSTLRGRLGPRRLDNAWAKGMALSEEQAVQSAIMGRDHRRHPARGWSSLTGLEQEVVRLIGEDCSNQEIADRLYISRNTVNSHVHRILSKVGVTSRHRLVRETVARTDFVDGAIEEDR